MGELRTVFYHLFVGTVRTVVRSDTWEPLLKGTVLLKTSFVQQVEEIKMKTQNSGVWLNGFHRFYIKVRKLFSRKTVSSDVQNAINSCILPVVYCDLFDVSSRVSESTQSMFLVMLVTGRKALLSKETP